MRQALRTSLGLALMLPGVTAAIAGGGFDLPPGATLSPKKLERVEQFLGAEIAARKIPGAIVLIRQHGKTVYSKQLGVREIATNLRMTDDTLFRLHSMTKPVTSVAAMMLVDAGKLGLDDPVAKYIPSFAGLKVGVERDAGDGRKVLDLVDPVRPPSVRDLLLHTSGITYGFYGEGLVRKRYGDADIYQGNFDNAEFAERIAQLPLAWQPGTLWEYGHSTDVLGRVIEVASGQSLFQFEKQRLFDPLGMTGTVYFVDAQRQPLVAKAIDEDVDPRNDAEKRIAEFRKWESGGGGLLTTVADFSRFAQMLLNGGSVDGTTYLSPEAFALLTSDHIGPDSGVARDYHYFPGDGFGFGLGLGVRTDPGNARPPPPGSLGELKWDGSSGCYFVIDRKQDMFFVLLQQTPSERQRIQREVKRLVYEALEN